MRALAAIVALVAASVFVAACGSSGSGVIGAARHDHTTSTAVPPSKILAQAKSRGVIVTDAEVTAQLQKVRKQLGHFEPSQFQRTKLNLLSSKMQAKVIKEHSKVTHAQIVEYYKSHPKRFETPERRDLLVVLTKTEADAARAKSRLSYGENFAKIAKEMSIDPTSKNDGGRLTMMEGQGLKGLEAAAFAADLGTLTGPVKTPVGYYVFEVQALAPARRQSLRQVETSIRVQVVAEQQEAAMKRYDREVRR